jgi:hypothetical protein
VWQTTMYKGCCSPLSRISCQIHTCRQEQYHFPCGTTLWTGHNQDTQSWLETEKTHHQIKQEVETRMGWELFCFTLPIVAWHVYKTHQWWLSLLEHYHLQVEFDLITNGGRFMGVQSPKDDSHSFPHQYTFFYFKNLQP